MIGRQQAELHAMVVLRLQEEFQRSVLGVLPDCLFVYRRRVVVPVPAEREEGEAVVCGEVDLSLHDRERIVAPTPDGLAFGKLFDHSTGEMRGGVSGPRLFGIFGQLVAARPAAKIVGPDGHRLFLLSGRLCFRANPPSRGEHRNECDHRSRRRSLVQHISLPRVLSTPL